VDDAASKIIVVIPAKDEASRIAGVISGALERAGRIVVVDDGSSDDTGEIARGAGAIVLRHRINLGKGAALRTGFTAALRLDACYIVCMDADGQHRPEDIPTLVEPLEKGEADIVFTARAMGAGESMPLVLNFGNRFLSGVVKLLFGISVRDTQCGFRAMKSDVFEQVKWVSSDYAVETEMIVRAGCAKLRPSEIEIPTIYLDRDKGTSALDGFDIFIRMFLWRIFPWAYTPR
jgi:glycosyltransferase involved in cell wall biosynthesis